MWCKRRERDHIWRDITYLLGFICLVFISGVDGSCSGRTVFENTWTGHITEGPGNYPMDVYCEWRIVAPDPLAKIMLNFTNFKSECTYDFLFIYDGNSFTSELIASFSGDTTPEPVVAYSGHMIIYLYSDTNYALDGVDANFYIQNCTNDCNGKGTCKDYQCDCQRGWKGDACQFESCPGNCGYDENRGQCLFITPMKCDCSDGYVGEGCDLPVSDNTGWSNTYSLSSGDHFKARTKHAGVYLQSTNKFWVFGGFTLNIVLDDTLYFDFSTNEWITLSLAVKPSARYGHTMVAYTQNTLLMFGGTLADGTISNELWSFIVTVNTGTWQRQATTGNLQMPGLTDHTACIVDDRYLYIYGGRSESVNFMSKMYRYDFTNYHWEEVNYRGGTISDLRVSGHSMVYHPESRSLIVFGGFKPLYSRQSHRSQSIYAFQIDYRYWTLWDYDKNDGAKPKHRALHTANIMGNYMVIFGGNTHEHNSHEKCYDNGIYYYHLGCHKWVNSQEISKDFSSANSRLPAKGRIGHVTAVRDGSILIISGGYSGIVLSDLIGYKVPGSIALNPNTISHLPACHLHSIESQCLDDPDCAWCRKKYADNVAGCLAFDEKELCENGFQTGDCPGLCSVLKECYACMAWQHGDTRLSDTPQHVVINQQCGWCVEDRKCYPKNAPIGYCGDMSTYTGVIPWWGRNGTFIQEMEHCRTRNNIPGMTWIKYKFPMNEAEPDEVSFVPSLNNDFLFDPIVTKESDKRGEYIGLYKGYILPLGATPTDHSGLGLQIKMWMRGKGSISTLSLSTDDTTDNLEQIAYDSAPNDNFRFNKIERNPVFPDTSRVAKYYMEFEAKQTILNNPKQQGGSTMQLDWNIELIESNDIHTPITAKFLQPYHYTGICNTYTNCLACMTDASCGWCSTSNTCITRNTISNDPLQCGSVVGAQYLITNPELCVVCEDFMDCLTCTENPLCEWLSDDTRCMRHGRFNEYDTVVSNPANCSVPCSLRTSCSECTDVVSECAWCQSTATCFAFASYISQFSFGQCSHWFDNIKEKKKKCLDCSEHTTCGECLDTFQCGWCGNEYNPTIGICHDGDYLGPDVEMSCSQLITEEHGIPLELSEWSYESCPDVEECKLGLDDCHPNATCENTQEYFVCHCNRGFQGDGKKFCDRTCYHTCIHGICSEEPEYICVCDLGWTGDDCNTNCGCHNHSTCNNGIGLCDECQYWTEGDSCELCKPGSYGNATTETGCLECACNGHGDSSLNNCHGNTGICYCIDNTRGDHCEHCVDGYYGNPVNNNKCYKLCEGRTFLTNAVASAFGSHEGKGVIDASHGYCLWIITVFDNVTMSSLLTIPTITLTLEENLQIECQKDHVYVYDGIPESISGVHSQSQSVMLGAFCGTGLREPITVKATSGVMTVVFEANIAQSAITQGFTALYTIEECPLRCHGNRQCVNGHCVCMDRYRGSDCQIQICPQDCNQHLSQGVCDDVLGLCRCSEGFAGSACDILITSREVIWRTLYDPLLQAPSDNSYPSLSRMGHSMVAAENNELWVYGGYSLEEGIKRDVQMYDLNSHTWQVKSTSSINMEPLGRYYHAAVYTNPRTMFIHGGITELGIAKDFWVLDLDESEWTRVEIPFILPALAGHSMTLIRDRYIVILGGYSPEDGLSDVVVQYDTEQTQWLVLDVKGTPPTGLYGHSTVWNAETESLYIYGGYRFHTDQVALSDKLYAFYYPDKTWSILTASDQVKQLPRYLHAAVTTSQHLIILAGATENNFTNSVNLYKYECNTWTGLSSQDIKVIGEPMKPTVSSAAVAIGNDIYIMGGFNGITHGTLVQLTLPDDLCTLHSTTIGCLQSHGCSACVSSNTTACFSNALSQPPSCEDEIAGVYCNRETIENRECEMLSTCSECLSPYPVYPDADLQCQWCYSCPVGRCIDKDLSCQIEHNCDKDQQALKNIESCPELICEASDCNKCISISACMWTRQIKKEGETRSTAHEYPIYDWSCFSSTLRDLSSFDIDSVPPSQCPVLCHEHSTCYKCLSSKGADGGWQECVWSEGLQQCMSPTYIQLQCVNGICEHVVRYTVDGCPTPCSLNTMCSTCLNQPGCGWCSFAGENGVGVCMAGGIHGPAEGGVCTAQNVSLRVDPLPAEIANYTLDLNGPPVWSFGGCPPENECRNGHHNCAQTEKCNDTLESYQCDCKEGYERDRSSGVCKPVCTQGCFNGQCVQPNVCDCYFGYVGGNCSIECECNGHSNCESIESRHKCIHCYNNTQGDHCEECLPFYVGNPENNGTCQPCRAYCNGNSDICMSITDYNLTMQKYNMLQESKITQSQMYNNMRLLRGYLKTYAQRQYSESIDQRAAEVDATVYCLSAYFEANEFVSSGAISNAICIGCENNSEGDQCETCIDGFFKMDGQCIPCECNGHWDWCDKETGLECQCDNHTETVCTGDNNEPCWKRQCASCKELYIGEPTNSHQCYRQMQYNNVYCFATTQSECDTATPPKPLPGGKSVFFAIQPKYTNVDIRLLIDVTVGALDVYLSYSEDTWVVTPDPNNGRHIINIDDKQYWEHSRRRRDEDHRYARETQTTDAITAPPTQQSIVNDLLEIYADGLNTFVTIHNPFTFLIVYSLRNRLVVTFPHVPHELETRKFYIVLLSKEEFSQNETHGILTFRQDQPHIDLFVFFSVFFSCFFLFLALCVIIWKVKLFFDSRRDRRRRAVEMENMASRPFSKVLVFIDPVKSAISPIIPPRRPNNRLPKLSRRGHDSLTRPKSPPPEEAFKIYPLAAEPTDDGISAVTTVMFCLPGGSTAPVRGCLGSSLVILRSPNRMTETRPPPRPKPSMHMRMQPPRVPVHV